MFIPVSDMMKKAFGKKKVKPGPTTKATAAPSKAPGAGPAPVTPAPSVPPQAPAAAAAGPKPPAPAPAAPATPAAPAPAAPTPAKKPAYFIGVYLDPRTHAHISEVEGNLKELLFSN